MARTNIPDVVEVPARHVRQADLVPLDSLEKAEVTVVGVGAVGRQVAIQLASMGVPSLRLIDFDVVEEVNLGPQAFLVEDVGCPKVKVTATLCKQHNSDLRVETILTRFNKFQKEQGNALFCCVDTMDSRKFIWEALGPAVDFFVDGRMAGEALRVVTGRVARLDDVLYYPDTLVSDDEATDGGCTTKSTIYSASVVAGLMVGQYAQHLRRLEGKGLTFVNQDFMYNLLTNDLHILKRVS